MKGEYKNRIEYLRNIPSYSLQPYKPEKFVRIKNVLPEYNFELTFFDVYLDYFDAESHSRKVTCDENYACTDEYVDDNHAKPMTLENFTNLFEVADYNFDGYPDFTFYSGHMSMKEALSYTVYPYDPESEKFYEAPSLSDVRSSTSFRINQEKQVLEACQIYSCCDFETTTYRIEHNVPVSIKHPFRTVTESIMILLQKRSGGDGAWHMR